MKLCFLPSVAEGTVLAPPSKSAAHRALISAALARGESRIFPVASSEDMLATMDALTALGASFVRRGDEIRVVGTGGKFSPVADCIPCRESGSTLRFLLPLALTTGEKCFFTGAPRLFERPLGVYETLARERGFLWQREESGLVVRGKLDGGAYSVDGSVSSQFITGLLFALSLCEEGASLTVTGKRESTPYVDMTVEIMRTFGAELYEEKNTFFLKKSTYRPSSFSVEGDWSQAAFFYGFQTLGDPVQVQGVRENSLQGDRTCRAYFSALRRGFCTLDLSQCPDLAPVMFAVAAASEGARFTGCRRLKMKESDRARAMAEELIKCGITLQVDEDEVVVEKGRLTSPREEISSHGDHRIAMAMSLILSRVGGVLTGAEAVDKSYPDFFKVLRELKLEWKKV